MSQPVRPRVVVSRRIFPELVEGLAADFDVRHNQADASWSAAELAAALREADGALLTAGDRIDDTLLAQCPRLKVVANIAVGYNNIEPTSACPGWRPISWPTIPPPTPTTRSDCSRSTSAAIRPATRRWPGRCAVRRA